MKCLMFTLCFSLPLLVSSQTMHNHYLKNEKSAVIDQGEIKFCLPEEKKQPAEKFMTLYAIQEPQTKWVEKKSLSHHLPASQHHELQMQLKEKMRQSVMDNILLVDSVYGYKYTSDIDSFLFVKIYLEYNEKAELWSHRRSELDSLSNSWENIYREDNFCDQNGNDTLTLIYEWNKNINDWVPQNKIILRFDAQERRTLYAIFQWYNHSQLWRGIEKLENAFDEWGNMTLYAYYEGWNDLTSSWIGSYKEEYAYDERGNQTCIILGGWDAARRGWMNYYKLESDFNDQGNPIVQVSSAWDPADSIWRYQEKQDSEFNEAGVQIGYANYNWDLLYERWIGEYREVVLRDNEFNEVVLNYSWNIKDEIWEADVKSVTEWNSERTYNKRTQYVARDSIIQTSLINGFNNDTSITKIWITTSCQDQTCSALDSEYVEGNASILWNYNISGAYYSTGGFCQIDINSNLDLSNTPGIALTYKVIEPSPASVIMLFTETNGETWIYKTQEVLSDTTGKWIVLPVSLSDIDSIGKYVDGYFDTGNIKNFQIRLHVPKGTKTSGSVLIDNFIACNIKKTDNWIPDNINENWYNADGYFTSSVSSRWDPSLQEFIPYYQYKSDLSFDENGNLTSNYSYVWDERSDEWIWIFKFEAEYNESNKQTRFESLSWDANAETWVGNQRQETVYDKFGNIIQFTDYQWNVLTGNWQPVIRNENSWNESGRQTSEANYTWNPNLAQWTGDYKNEIIFNELDEEVKTIYYVWDYDLSDWSIASVYLNFKYQEVFDINGNPVVTIYSYWNDTKMDWTPTEKYYFIYSTHVITEAATQELILNGPVLVYPNPAKDQFKVKFSNDVRQAQIYLFSANGYLVKKQLANGNIVSVSIDNLPDGIYLLSIKANGEMYSQKVIIDCDK